MSKANYTARANAKATIIALAANLSDILAEKVFSI
jgi:hypothetical protein